ncbi:hypothetical protein [Profundibacter sp.]
MDYYAYAARKGEIKVYDAPQCMMSQPLVGCGDGAFMERLYAAAEYKDQRMHVPGVAAAKTGLEALAAVRKFRQGMEARGFV